MSASASTSESASDSGKRDACRDSWNCEGARWVAPHLLVLLATACVTTLLNKEVLFIKLLGELNQCANCLVHGLNLVGTSRRVRGQVCISWGREDSFGVLKIIPLARGCVQ